jgi:hypothetical protein
MSLAIQKIVDISFNSTTQNSARERRWVSRRTCSSAWRSSRSTTPRKALAKSCVAFTCVSGAPYLDLPPGALERLADRGPVQRPVVVSFASAGVTLLPSQSAITPAICILFFSSIK